MAPAPQLEDNVRWTILSILSFLVHEIRHDLEMPVNEDELRASAPAMENNKAPGSDAIPSEMLKLIADVRATTHARYV